MALETRAAIDLGAPAREAIGLGRACVQDDPRLRAQAPSGGPLALTRESIAEMNQALAALLFFYKEVLEIKLPWLDGIVRFERRRNLIENFTFADAHGQTVAVKDPAPPGRGSDHHRRLPMVTQPDVHRPGDRLPRRRAPGGLLVAGRAVAAGGVHTWRGWSSDPRSGI